MTRKGSSDLWNREMNPVLEEKVGRTKKLIQWLYQALPYNLLKTNRIFKERKKKSRDNQKDNSNTLNWFYFCMESLI